MKVLTEVNRLDKSEAITFLEKMHLPVTEIKQVFL